MKIKNYIFLTPLIFITLSCKGLYFFKSNNDISENALTIPKSMTNLLVLKFMIQYAGAMTKLILIFAMQSAKVLLIGQKALVIKNLF